MSTGKTRRAPVVRAGLVGLAVVLPGIAGLAQNPAPKGTGAETVDFTRDIRPIFISRCSACHGPVTQRAGLRLDRRPDAQQLGPTARLIVPGKSAQSELLARLTSKDPRKVMPPSGQPLTESEIARIRAWIDQGAAWPEATFKPVPSAPPKGTDPPMRPRPVPSSTPGMPGNPGPLLRARTPFDHWSFQPVGQPDVPRVKHPEWVRTPIDAFILAELEKKGIQPSPEADRVTLIRRLSLDLLGLPPSPEEVDAFVRDTRPDAYEQVVDRLLRSSHYGERWGRHWLDLARYADSNGFAVDSARTIWPYRDWVIDALNRDLPFDQFTVEQLAGDLLPNSTDAQKIATGFHRNTLINEEGGTDKEQFRVEAVVDRVATTGTVWLGLSVGCAQCHDHKYDPISQKEFFQLYAFFNNADDASLTAPSPLTGAMSPTLIMRERNTPRATHIQIRGDFLQPGAPVQPGLPGVLPSLPETDSTANRLDLARWLMDPANPLTARVTVNRVWQQYFGTGLVDTENDFGVQGSKPTHPELLDYLAGTFSRPSIGSKPVTATGTWRGKRGGGRDGTPLTAAFTGPNYALRKTHYAGPATRPAPPASQPGLGWSMKALHRLIVTSAVYRQSSRNRVELVSVDANNRLLARQSRMRLEAEVVRDLALASSGLLSRKLGGPSVFPPQPAGLDLFTQRKKNWKASTGEDRYRRGIYTYFWRSSPYPLFTTLDAPNANVTCTRRARSNTPLGALMLANDQSLFELAQGLASRILKDAPAGEAERIRFAFRQCLAREPNPVEAVRLLAFYREQAQLFAGAPEEAKKAVPATVAPGTDPAQAAAWTALARVLMNLDEFITRE